MIWFTLETSVKKFLPVLAVAFLLSSCTVGKDQSLLAVEGQGYSNVELGGPALFGCDKGDKFTRTWKATDQQGRRVKGVVCSGFFKGATVRLTGRA